jgi:phage shock protein E
VAKSYEDLVSEAKGETEQTSVEEIHDALERGEEVTVVDVREPDEWEAGHVPGAKHLPRGFLEYKAADGLPDKDARIVVHCALGGAGRSPRKACRRWDTPTSPTCRAG